MDGGYLITFADVMAGVIALGLAVITFFIKGWIAGVERSTEGIKKQIKENDEKVNGRIDRLKDKTEGEISEIRQEISDIKGDFATTFVLREDFFRSMNGVEDKMRSIDNKIDKLLLQNSGRNMNESEKAEVRQNKAVRGYIIRCLVKGYNNTALTRQLSNAMIAAGLVISPDISKHLDYLEDAGYIEFTEEKVTAYNAYAHDAVIKLTKEGVDLAEGTIEDNGVDI